MYLAKKILSIAFLTSFLIISNAYACSDCDDCGSGYRKSRSVRDYRDEAIYRDPPRQSLDVYGRYIISTSSVRYVNSPSRLKRARHAARVDVNNRMYEYN